MSEFIEVFTFDKLPNEMQHKIHELAGWRENPWTRENYDSWENFCEEIIPEKVKWDSEHGVSFLSYSEIYNISGKRLVKYLYKKLNSLPEFPTGYCMDAECFGFARENISEIIKQKMNFEGFVNFVFLHFVEMCNEDDDFYNSFECFKEYAIFNELKFTKDGIEV